MIIMFIFFMTIFYILGFATNKALSLRTKTNPEPPLLNSPDQVMYYLEACAVTENNQNMLDAISKVRENINVQNNSSFKSLELWHHDSSKKIPFGKLWELILRDVEREELPSNKLEVIKSWMIDRKIDMTHSEVDLLLDQFDKYEDRRIIRDFYSKQLAERENDKRSIVQGKRQKKYCLR